MGADARVDAASISRACRAALGAAGRAASRARPRPQPPASGDLHHRARRQERRESVPRRPHPRTSLAPPAEIDRKLAELRTRNAAITQTLPTHVELLDAIHPPKA